MSYIWQTPISEESSLNQFYILLDDEDRAFVDNYRECRRCSLKKAMDALNRRPTSTTASKA